LAQPILPIEEPRSISEGAAGGNPRRDAGPPVPIHPGGLSGQKALWS